MVVIINVLNMSIIAECSTCITALHNRIIITVVHVFISTAVHVVSGWIQNGVLGNDRGSFIFQRNHILLTFLA